MSTFPGAFLLCAGSLIVLNVLSQIRKFRKIFSKRCVRRKIGLKDKLWVILWKGLSLMCRFLS